MTLGSKNEADSYSLCVLCAIIHTVLTTLNLFVVKLLSLITNIVQMTLFLQKLQPKTAVELVANTVHRGIFELD